MLSGFTFIINYSVTSATVSLFESIVISLFLLTVALIPFPSSDFQVITHLVASPVAGVRSIVPTDNEVVLLTCF